MIPEIKKILYATDLSKNARHAFVYAAALANSYEGLITVLHVIEGLPPSADFYVSTVMGKERWQKMQEENKEEVANIIRKRLEEFCDEMDSELTACPFIVDSILVRQGNPVEEILDLSRSGKYDMVVMGSHGHGMFSNALMGNTARRVVKRSTLPVLVIPHRE